MSISTAESMWAAATHAAVTDDTLTVELSDGRTVSVPLAWYPRLLHGTAEERGRWRLIGQGRGMHWPDLDEDISVANLLAGKPSGESQPCSRNGSAVGPAARETRICVSRDLERLLSSATETCDGRKGHAEGRRRWRDFGQPGSTASRSISGGRLSRLS